MVFVVGRPTGCALPGRHQELAVHARFLDLSQEHLHRFDRVHFVQAVPSPPRLLRFRGHRHSRECTDLAALTAANHAGLPTNQSDDFWQTLRASIDECDRLIHELCDIRGDDLERRADLLAVRKRMAPNNLAGDIAYLKTAIAEADRAPRIITPTSRHDGTPS